MYKSVDSFRVPKCKKYSIRNNDQTRPLFFIVYIEIRDFYYLCFVVNALIFSHLNYCSSIYGKCSEKLQYEVQKCINFAAKVASNMKYLKRDHVTHYYETWNGLTSIVYCGQIRHPLCIKICMFQQIQMWKRLTLTSETRYHRE